jgi:KaiC/GvpD/RAD55 family RecA-like ATPase
MAVKIFFCYAHEDEALLNKLKAHLRPLQLQGLIDIWYDRDINAGMEWEKEIDKHLNTADLILLLVSPDFINSDYCYSTEMKRAMERHEKGEAHVIPIILRHVYWQGMLGKLQALPTDAKPVTSSFWHTFDEAFLDVIEGILKTLQKLREQPSTGEASASFDPFSQEVIPTGLEDLDRIMGGGFQRSDLIIVGAPPSAGKTSLILNIVLNTAVKYARSVGIFSLEMSKKRLLQRLLALDAHINQQILQTGKLENEDWERVVYALGALSDAKIWIIDSVDITIIELLRQAQKLVNECKVDLIIVDYVNLMQTEVNQNYDISRLLKVMARQLDIPVIAIVQMPRLLATRRSKVPQLSDMDISFEKDADIVMFIYRDDVYNPESERKNMVDIIVAKHRNGPVGEISLYFRPDIGYFHDLVVNPQKGETESEG